MDFLREVGPMHLQQGDFPPQMSQQIYDPDFPHLCHYNYVVACHACESYTNLLTSGSQDKSGKCTNMLSLVSAVLYIIRSHLCGHPLWATSYSV